MQLVLEGNPLRQQLAVYKRNIGKPNLTDRGRRFRLSVVRMLEDLRKAPVIVQPTTVINWHRDGLRYCRRRSTRSQPGRPPIAMAVILLIRRMSFENVTWGALGG